MLEELLKDKVSLFETDVSTQLRAQENRIRYVKSGDESLEKLISKVKKGILVGDFSGGEPGVNGEFSGVAPNSFLIEDGQIKGALTETTINDNFADMFNNLVGISEETECDGNMVLLYVAFDGIVVSGK